MKTSSTKPKLFFVVTEDWFFARHFLPMAQAAADSGLDVSVLTRCAEHKNVLETVGIRVIALNETRSVARPMSLIRYLRGMIRIFRAERPDIVHFIALKPIVIGGLAARLTCVSKRIYAITGMGLLAVHPGVASRIARFLLQTWVRLVLEGPKVEYIFENDSDPRRFGLAEDNARVTIVGGAGVDPKQFPVLSMPTTPPLRVAVVARMIWSKGIDVTVDAIRIARAGGAQVELSLFGAPDLANPRNTSRQQLDNWAESDGIRWYGHVADVQQIWATHHLCCLASRGGEGLPRTILEAAACGRPIITTDVPGCSDFVRHGVEGFVVRSGDSAALAQHLVAIARDPQALQMMGIAARKRILQGFSQEAVITSVMKIYHKLLSR